MEPFIHYLSELDPLWIYAAIALIAFIENIFPPFPSDVVVVAAGSLAGLGRVDFVIALLLATGGSTVGFIAMYKIGEWFGVKILEQGKLRKPQAAGGDGEERRCPHSAQNRAISSFMTRQIGHSITVSLLAVPASTESLITRQAVLYKGYSP